MAIMIPIDINDEYGYVSDGEKRLFGLFREFPENYVIFHSLRWANKWAKEDSDLSKFIQNQGEADFVILNKDKGIIVLEVKDGIISVEKGQWYQTPKKNRNYGNYLRLSPKSQADQSKYFIKKFLEENLKKSEVNLNNSYSIQSVVCFPDTALSSIWTTELNENNTILHTDLSTSKGFHNKIEEIFNNYSKSSQVSKINGNYLEIINILCPSFGVLGGIGPETLHFFKMTHEQSKILSFLEDIDEVAISGVAGTGKTLLAVEKAKRLAHEECGKSNEEGFTKVLLLCSTNLLEEYLVEIFQNHPGVDAMTFAKFHKVAKDVCEVNFSTTRELIIEGTNKRLEYLLAEGIQYKHIIIDEAQDIDASHLALLQKFARERQGSFFLFYDFDQVILIDSEKDPQQLSEHLESLKIFIKEFECRLPLTENCRNNKGIALTSTRPLGLPENKIKLKIKKREGTPGEDDYSVILNHCKDEKEIADRIKEFSYKYINAEYEGTLKERIKEEDIVILTCLDSKNSIVRHIKNKLIFENGDKINFSSVKRFKGLESKIVFLVDVNESTFTSADNGRVFYAGASRAKMKLHIMTTLDPKERIQINASERTSLYDFLMPKT